MPKAMTPSPSAAGRWTAHTPTPWFPVNIGTERKPMWSVKASRIAGRPPGHEVAICATGDSPQAMETANAHFIALACNSHAALFEALAALNEYAHGAWFDEADATDDERELMHRVRTALAAASQAGGGA